MFGAGKSLREKLLFGRKKKERKRKVEATRTRTDYSPGDPPVVRH